jgi:urea transporter
VAVREPGVVASRDGDGDGPTPAFWRAVRMLLNRVRIGLYGLASALFAALLTGSLVRQPTRWVMATGVLMSIVLCLAAVLLEMVDLNLGKGKSDDH